MSLNKKLNHRENDTFDYNWDDESVNASIANKSNVKAGIKGKLMLNSIKKHSPAINKHERVS